jgi:transcriptional regulator with XRE-family HTH domain
MDAILERILNELKKQGKRQYELTDYLNLNHNSFGNWKSGLNKSYLKYLYQIAEFLGVSVEYIKGETDEKNTASEETETDQKFLKMLKSMTPEEKDLFYGIMKSIIEQKKNKEE